MSKSLSASPGPVAVAVVGATGNQGSAVVKQLAASHLPTDIRILAFTRNIESSAARKLTEVPGGESVVATQVDLDEVVRRRSADVLQGAEIVFANTNTFEGGPEKEVARGKALVDAAKAAGVKLFIWSALPSASRISDGKYDAVSHFETKAEVTEYLKGSGLNWIAIGLGWFAENIETFEMIQKTPSGFAVRYPVLKEDTQIPWSWVARDVGPIVAALVKAHLSGRWTTGFKRYIPIASFRASMADFVAEIEAQTGLKGVYEQLPAMGNSELDDMHHLFNEFDLNVGLDLPHPDLKELGVKFSTMKEIVAQLVVPSLQ